MYYIVENNQFYTSDSMETLQQLYPNHDVISLPKDFLPKKYILEDNQLVLNPKWDAIQLEEAKQKRNAEIDEKIKELSSMASVEMIKGNTSNVALYNEVIQGLEEARP